MSKPLEQMEWKLELVLLPVADVDRAKAFYVEQAGFALDVDHRAGDSFRIVQVTPPGSACSVGFGIGLLESTPGPVRGLHLVVPDIEAAHAQLAARGVAVDAIRHLEAGEWVAGPHPARGDYESFSGFTDPDGNSWVLQEVGWRAPE
jgi:catechol 2,3-dioxygenase-like lactoylglutathione lyase family enzyme